MALTRVFPDITRLENQYNRFVADTIGYPTIQDAIDACAATASGGQAKGEVYVPARGSVYSELLNIPSGAASFVMEGQGTNTRIEGSGGHTLTINEQDVFVSRFWIDQIDSASESFDAVHVNATEVRLEGLDIDFSPRHGIYFGGNRGHIAQCDIQAGEVSGLYVPNSPIQWLTISGLECVNVPGKGILLDGQFCSGSAIVVRNSGDDGIVINGNFNNITCVVTNNTNRGIVINGNNNVVNVISRGNGSNGVRVDGQNNAIHLNTSGNNTNDTGDDLFCSSNSTGNVITGYAQSFSDSGNNTLRL